MNAIQLAYTGDLEDEEVDAELELGGWRMLRALQSGSDVLRPGWDASAFGWHGEGTSDDGAAVPVLYAPLHLEMKLKLAKDGERCH